MTTYNWTGGGGNDLWSNLNNWDPNNGPPGAFDTADIGTDNFSIAINGTSGVGDLDLGIFVLGSPVGSTVAVDNGGLFLVEGSSTVIRASTLESEPGGTITLLFDGTLANGGTVLVGQDFNGGGGSSTLNVDGDVTLTASGTLELGQVSANPFAPPSTGNIANSPNTTDTLVNQSNTILGAGSIALGTFDNRAGGTVEAGQSGRGTLSVSAGTLSNEGSMIATTGATLHLGQDNTSASLTNSGSITVNPNGTLQIAGDYTISGGGNIQLAPETEQQEQNQVPPAQIVSDGSPAELVLANQSLKGAGVLGDANLVLVNSSSTVAADQPEEILTIDTGSNVITNGGTLAAINNGFLTVKSQVGNSGTIEANGGFVTLDAAVTVPNFPPGQHSTIDIGADGAIEASSSVAGNVTFTSGGAALAVSSSLPNGGIGGEVVGATTSDQIFFENLSMSAQQVSWQQNGGSGTLSLLANGSVLASINLAGQYTSNDFTLIANENGVELQNPAPSAATTADMIMQDGSNGAFEIYDLGSNAIQTGDPLGQPFAPVFLEGPDTGGAAGPNWHAVGLGDFGFGYEYSDIMLRNSATGALEAWDIVNNNITQFGSLGQVGLEWAVAGFGDFSGGVSESDMLMRNSNTGAFEIYDIFNNAIQSAVSMGQVGVEWQVAGCGDFSTRPGEDDMLMRNASTGAFEVYDISDDHLVSAASMGQVGLEWQVAGFGDFSGNANETDMLMRNTSTGAFEIYDISNNTITSAASMGQVGLEWQVAGFGPIDGSGSSDMLMRNVNTGAFEIYDISNNQLVNAAPMGQVGTEWSVAGIASSSSSAPANVQLTQTMASYAPAGSVPIGGGNTMAGGVETAAQSLLTLSQAGS